MTQPGPHAGQTLARGSALMASGSLASRILGLVRMVMLTAIFGGVGAASNAWQVANTLPTTVYMLLAGGVINAVLVPQITKAARQDDGGREYVDRLLTVSFAGLLAITALAFPLAPALVSLFSERFDPATFELAVNFTRIVLPAVFFYGVYAVLGQVLNARNRFGAYGWAPALANVVMIVALIAFMVAFPGMAPQVRAWTWPMAFLLAGSLTVGVAAQALVLLVPLWRDGWRYRPRWGVRGFGLGSAGRVALWTVAGVAASQLALAASSKALTSVGDGHVGKMAYDNAFFLFMTPHGLLTVSLVTALFTNLATHAAAGEVDRVRASLRTGLRLIGVVTIPTTIAGVALARSGTAVLFVGNTREVTDGMAHCFMLLVLALLPFGVLFLVQRAFYAFEDARTPFLLALLAAVIFAAGSLAALALPDEHRALGVAGAATVSDIAAALVGLRWVAVRLGPMRLLDVGECYTRTLFAALAAGLPTLGVVFAVDRLIGGRPGALLALLLGAAVFALVFVVGARFLHVPEVARLLEPVRRRLSRPAH